MTMYALVTNDGTAASETALCLTHMDDDDAVSLARSQAGPDIAPHVVTGHPPEFNDCTGNDALECIVCGAASA